MRFSYRIDARDTRPEPDRNKSERVKLAEGEVSAPDLPAAMQELGAKLAEAFAGDLRAGLVRCDIRQARE